MLSCFRGLATVAFVLASVLHYPTCAQEPERVEYLQLQNLFGVQGGNLIVSVSSVPSSFDRMMTSGLANTVIAERLSADLVHINRGSLQLEPSLVTRWEANITGRIYTIHLRKTCGLQSSCRTFYGTSMRFQSAISRLAADSKESSVPKIAS